MILSDSTIINHIKDKTIEVSPFVEEHVQPASIDLTLGSHFLEVDTANTEGLKLDQEIQYREINSNEIVIPAKSFLLATNNFTELANFLLSASNFLPSKLTL